MIEYEQDQAILSRLVGCWTGTVLHRTSAGQPFEHTPGTSENRWVLGGRFVEMTLRARAAGDSWSAVFYIGHERSERRHVLVSLGPGDRRVATLRGEWVHDGNRLRLTSEQSRATCDVTTAGELKLEFAEHSASGQDFVRYRAEFRQIIAAAIVSPHQRQPRRFVIA